MGRNRDTITDVLEREQPLQHRFQNMFQDYDGPADFEACWQAFQIRYPNNPFPRDYAEHLWHQEWSVDTETQPHLTWDEMRRRIIDNVECYERTSLGFETCAAYYNEDMGEWILIYPTLSPRQASEWDDLRQILRLVPDHQIQAWYEQWAAQDYDDE